MCNSKELTAMESRELLLNPVYQTIQRFEMQQRMAKMYAQSTIVPKTYQANLGNCVIAIDMAQRMQANPLMVMQNLYIVNGNPSWSSKFLISCINMSGRYTSLRYQFTGKKGTPEYGCRAYAYEKSDKDHKEPLCSIWITLDMAKKEGWSSKPGSKWLTMADQMLIYRAAAFWQRAYAPEIGMGFLTKEEVEDGITTATYDAIPVDDGEEVPEPPIEEPAPKDEVEAAMKKQNKTNYRAPHPTETEQPAPSNPAPKQYPMQEEEQGMKVDTSTGELFNK